MSESKNHTVFLSKYPLEFLGVVWYTINIKSYGIMQKAVLSATTDNTMFNTVTKRGIVYET